MLTGQCLQEPTRARSHGAEGQEPSTGQEPPTGQEPTTGQEPSTGQEPPREQEPFMRQGLTMGGQVTLPANL